MAKQKKQGQDVQQGRPPRARLSAAESLKRTRAFAQRKEQFIASVRKGKNRGVSA
jgi:hypothetical protein